MLGSRLKRVGEKLLSEVGRVYRDLGIPFEPSWFPVFFLLDRHGTLPVPILVREMGVTDSAVSQLVKQMQHHGLLDENREPRDRRTRILSLSPAGKELLDRVRPVWQTLSAVLAEMGPGGVQPLLRQLDDLEEAIQVRSLTDRVRLILHESLQGERLLSETLEEVRLWSSTLPDPVSLPADGYVSGLFSPTYGLSWVCRQGRELRGLLQVEAGPAEDLVRIFLCSQWDIRIPMALLQAWKRDRQGGLLVHLAPAEILWPARLEELGFLPERLLPAPSQEVGRLLEWRWNPSR